MTIEKAFCAPKINKSMVQYPDLPFIFLTNLQIIVHNCLWKNSCTFCCWTNSNLVECCCTLLILASDLVKMGAKKGLTCHHKSGVYLPEESIKSWPTFCVPSSQLGVSRCCCFSTRSRSHIFTARVSCYFTQNPMDPFTVSLEQQKLGFFQAYFGPRWNSTTTMRKNCDIFCLLWLVYYMSSLVARNPWLTERTDSFVRPHKSLLLLLKWRKDLRHEVVLFPSHREPSCLSPMVFNTL